MKAIFLDRDGVINKYPGDKKYVTSWRKFKFIQGSRSAIARLSDNKFKIFVVSNQAGIGKGIYSQRTLSLITKNMLQKVKEAGGRIEAVYYCTHPKEANCSCRKPKTGLIFKATRKYPLNLKNSFFIGDTIRDVHTAHNAGCRSILVLSGKEKLSNRRDWEVEPDFVFSNLKEAARFILGQAKARKGSG